jgi:hypothetical protein
MSRNLDLYNAYYIAAWANPPTSLKEANESYLSDDFESLDKDGNVVMDKEAYVEVFQQLAVAIKDFKWMYSDLHEEDDSVIVSGRFLGKHTGDLDLSVLGLGVIPASGKMILWPKVSNEFRFDGDKISSIKPHEDSDGVESFLGPFGVSLPSS